MTFKSAAAGLPLGGGKGVIMLRAGDPPLDGERRRDALLDFGDAVGSLDGRYITAEDVGTSDGDMTVIAERTDHVAGLARRARRLRRSEPVDGAGRRGRDPRHLRGASGARRTSPAGRSP